MISITFIGFLVWSVRQIYGLWQEDRKVKKLSEDLNKRLAFQSRVFTIRNYIYRCEIIGHSDPLLTLISTVGVNEHYMELKAVDRMYAPSTSIHHVELLTLMHKLGFRGRRMYD